MVRLSAVAIKIADSPMGSPCKLTLDTPPWEFLCSFNASTYSTRVAPGIFRKAAVTAQLNMTVSTNAIAALTIAGRS